MKGDILHRDNFLLILFNRVNLLEYNQNFTEEKYLQELHKVQRKLSIERENVMSNNFKFSVGIVTTIALIGIILQNIYAAILSENKSFNRFTLIHIKNENIFLFFMILINYLVNIGIILGTCYLNIYSEGMVDDKKGTKLHKKIGKLIYKFGMFSSVLYFVEGFSEDINFYILTIAIIQGYFLIMCISTACLKQYLSHRVWSYCLNSLFLQIALNAYLDQLAQYFEQEYLASYSCCLSSIFCILYLYKQELSIDKVVPKSKATFQISLDSISQKVIFVNEKIEENPFKTVYCDKNIIKKTSKIKTQITYQSKIMNSQGQDSLQIDEQVHFKEISSSHTLDERKQDKTTNADQDTQETINDSSKVFAEGMQLNSFHNDYKYNPHPYNLYLTPITEEIDHEKTIVGLKEQNKKLTDQLRFLNKKLTEILDKQQKKVSAKQELEQKSKDITIVQKELDNSYKKIEYLQKQNKFLQQKLEKLSPSMIQNLEVELKEKEQLIQKQQDEIKAFENIKRMLEKNNSLESKQIDVITKIDDQEKKIASQNTEIKKLKSLLDNQQKQMLKKQEYQVDLEQKFREVCEYLGIPSSAKQNLKEELQKIHIIKTADPNPQNFLTEINKNQQGNIQNNQSPHKIVNLKQYEIQIKELNRAVKLKDKEISQLKQQIQELKHLPRSENQHSIQYKRVNKSISGQLNLQSISNNEKSCDNILIEKRDKKQNIISKDLLLQLQKENQNPNIIRLSSAKVNSNQSQLQLLPLKEEQEKIKKEIMGKQHGCTRSITDRNILKEQLHSKIVKVIVWTNKRTINGVQFFYKVNESIVEGQKMVVENKNEYNQIVLDFNNKTDSNNITSNKQLSVDYLKQVECMMSSQGYIDKLKFISANGKIYEAGAQSNQGKIVQKFNLDQCEYPVCSFGGLITFVGEKEQEVGSILSFLGLEIMIDRQVLKGSNSQYIPKGFSTFYFDKEQFKQLINGQKKEQQAEKICKESI
ncbi:hypothetical protein ABPG72_012310 [Tetrahymena utriculariae]